MRAKDVSLGKRWGVRLAAASLVVGASAAITPVASAAEATAPCEAVLPPTLCEQVRETSVFVIETVGRVGPIVGETTAKVFSITDSVYALVKCTVQGTCPPM